MADDSTSTPALNDQGEPLVDFADAANMDFEAVAIDLAALPTAAQINNPYMVTVRLAATCLTKTKGELIDVVTALGCERDDGGEMGEMLDRMHAAEKLFGGFVEMLQTADARLFIASCAASR